MRAEDMDSAFNDLPLADNLSSSSINMKENAKSIVLVGRTGNGKSATGNTILGRSAFQSMFCTSGVTTTSELHSTELEDGQTLNVIDTPGLFDFSGDTKFIGREIANCIDLANDGLHAIVLVLSIRGRFSREEAAVVQALSEFFGPKIIDYMIIVFTGGDGLEDEAKTLDDYLGGDCPKPLKDTLTKCGNRKLLFNNKSRDEADKSRQRRDLLSLVNNIVENNGGLPYTNQLFIEIKGVKQMREVYSKEEVSDIRDQLQKLHDEQLMRVIAMIEAKFKLSLDVVNQQLAAEQVARMMAYEKYAQQLQDEKLARLLAESQTAATIASQKEMNEKIRKMEEELRTLQHEAADPPDKRKCAIL